jgi:hypothetical protein
MSTSKYHSLVGGMDEIREEFREAQRRPNFKPC